MKKTMILLISAISIWGCKTDNADTCILPSAITTSNSPVVTGSAIQLNTSDYGEGFTYSWAGPNGFVSSSQNPIIENTTLNMQGMYTLTVSKGICITKEATIDISVYENPVNCTPVDNTVVFDQSIYALPTLSMYSVTTFAGSSNYELRSYGSQGDLDFNFMGSSAPLTGVYNITGEPSPSNGEVSVSLVYSNQFMRAQEGLVSVTYIDGKISATFCDVIFHLQTLDIDLITSSHIIDN